jgi:hypothetical protein
MTGVFPGCKAPIVRTGAEGGELATARRGVPSPHALMESTKKRVQRLELIMDGHHRR